MSDAVTVPVVSAAMSKINWTQVIGSAINLATWASTSGVIPEKYQAPLAIGIQFVTSVTTWYFRTFKTTSITPSSVPPATGSG